MQNSVKKIIIKFSVAENAFYNESLVLEPILDKLIIKQDNALTTKRVQEYCFRNNEVKGVVEDIMLFAEHNNWQNFNTIKKNRAGEKFSFTVYFTNNTNWKISGNYVKESLPGDWNEMIGILLKLITPTQQGEIRLLDINFATPDNQKSYIYAKVSLDTNTDKPNWYQVYDKSIKVGEKVIVPLGEKNIEKIGIISEVHYYNKDELPIMLDLVKAVICKVADRQCVSENKALKFLNKKVLIECFDGRVFRGLLQGITADKNGNFNEANFKIITQNMVLAIPVYDIKSIKKKFI